MRIIIGMFGSLATLCWLVFFVSLLTSLMTDRNYSPTRTHVLIIRMSAFVGSISLFVMLLLSLVEAVS